MKLKVKTGETREPRDQADRTLSITRLFEAPREVVFKAWSDPVGISNWWGPRGFTTTTQAMDFRSGGLWRFVMHGPDGVDYPNLVAYEEITPPERIVYAHRGEGEFADIQFHVTVTFVAQGGRTELTMSSVFPTVEARNRVVEEHGALEGMYDTMARFAEHLANSLPQ